MNAIQLEEQRNLDRARESLRQDSLLRFAQGKPVSANEAERRGLTIADFEAFKADFIRIGDNRSQ